MCSCCGAILPSATSDARATAVANNAARQLRCDDVADVPEALRDVLKDVADIPTHIRVLTDMRETAVAAERARCAAIAEAHAVHCDINARDAIIDRDDDAETAWNDMAESARSIRNAILAGKPV